MKTIVINGANGYVASHFINELLKQNYHVVALVRANKKYLPKERMEKVLADINVDEAIADTSNLEVFSYSLLDKNFSMPEEKLKEIFAGQVDYFHFAASLKYDEKSIDEIFSTNIEGVENSIKIFSEYASPDSRFFYIGTAYSCGKTTTLFEEKFYKNEDITHFRNYYEQSKRFAENVVKKHIEKSGIEAYIIRLAQVAGHERTGITKTDYGIFDFAKRIFSLASRYPNEKIRVHVNPESTQNLIPIDTVVKYFMATVKEEQVPRIMNFVANQSIRNGHIISQLNRLLPIELIPQKKLNRKEMTSLERLISAGMSFSESYTETDLTFDTTERDKFIQPNGSTMNEHAVSKMLAYFITDLSEKKKMKKQPVAQLSK